MPRMLRFLEFLAARGVLAALQAVPHDAALRLARGFARQVCALDRPHRERAMEHLRLAYGDTMRNGRALEITRGVFETIARHVVNTLHAPRRGDHKFELRNPENIMTPYHKGKGIIFVSAHLGSFTMLCLLPKIMGFRAASIMKRQKNDQLLAWVADYLEKSFGVEIVLKTEARDQVPGLLRKGRVMGFFADQHPRGGGSPATFFSRPIDAAVGPAIYAKRCGSAIVVVTTTDRPDGTHVVNFDGPISTEGKLREINQRWVTVLEKRIREHPDQWMWMHRRWRETTP